MLEMQQFAAITDTAHIFYTSNPLILEKYGLDSDLDDRVFLKPNDSNHKYFKEEFDQMTTQNLELFYKRNRYSVVLTLDD